MDGTAMSEKICRSNMQDEYWFQEGCHILEVANHPDDPQVSIVRARVEPGVTTQWHCLHKTWERYLVIAGEGVAEIGDLAPARVSAGDVVFIPPDTRQRIRNAGIQDLVFYAICSPRFTPECYRSLE
jgi:mannose-6-phosphate isomerase-like protein (cupin superfamily)